LAHLLLGVRTVAQSGRARGPAADKTEAPIASELRTTLARRLGLEPEEQRTLVLMGVLVGVLLCAYTLAKVVRDALFIANFGSLALPYGYVGVALASVAFVWMEGRLARRYPRLDLTRFNQRLAIVFGIAAAAVYPLARTWTTAAFYLWTGSQAMLLIPHFWVLALDVWDSHRARHLFPVLSGCGLIGGVVGGGIAGWLTPVVKRVGLIWIVAGLFIIVHGLTVVLQRHRGRRASPLEFATGLSRWEILRRSGYLRLLAVALALAVIVGTLIDFQFKFFIQRIYPDPHALTQFLGRFQVVLNVLALIVQFGAVGWVFHRLGLTASSLLQPTSVMLFAAWVAATGGWWAIVGMRWAQGVVLQTLGKSTSEIYYAAVRPPERRRIKPAVDTLVERWSDAAVGLLLIALLHAVGIAIPVLVAVTLAIAAAWLVALLLLNRQYGRAFEEALSRRWVDPELAPESVRTPAAEAALRQALQSEEPSRLTAALRLAGSARGSVVADGVARALEHSSPKVRAAAIQAAETLRLSKVRDRVSALEHDPDEAVSSAALRYGLAMSRNPLAYARERLEAKEGALCRLMVDALFDRPHAAPGALTPEWIDREIERGDTDSLILAARAIGATPGSAARSRLKALLADPDVEVKRAALLAATRRPTAQLTDSILSLLFTPMLGAEARGALAAIGDPAIPALARFLGTDRTPHARTIAARALAEVGTRRAQEALLALARSADPADRTLGLRNLSLIRVRSGQPVLPRALAHRLFLRELRSYRAAVEPSIELERSPSPEVRLFAESYLEYGEAALERGMRALACWYDPKPIGGALDRLKARGFEQVAPALEYLVHVLPQSVFRPVREIFESKLVRERSQDGEGDGHLRLAERVRSAWELGDAWMRACAVRVSALLPEADRSWFAGGEPSALVEAELAARFPEPGDGMPQTATVRGSRC